MATITRRLFFTAIGATILARPALAGTGILPVPVHCFIGESGKRGRGLMVVGVLRTTDPDAHEAAIAEIRRTHAYSRELTYASTDRKKLGFASAVLDYANAAGDLTFTATTFVSSDPGHAVHARAARVGIYRDALASALREGALIHVPEDIRRPDRFLAQELGAETVVHRSADLPNLMQLAGFLAGCIYGDATGASHPVKRELIARSRIASRLMA